MSSQNLHTLLYCSYQYWYSVSWYGNIYRYCYSILIHVYLGEDLAASHAQGGVHHVGKWVGVPDCGGVEAAVVAARVPGAMHLPHNVEGGHPQAVQMSENARPLKGANSALAAVSFSASNQQNLEAIRSPVVRRWCTTPCKVWGRTSPGAGTSLN